MSNDNASGPGDLGTVVELTPQDVGMAAADGTPVSARDMENEPRILTLGELLTVKAKDWLVQDILQLGDLALLYGPSGEGKSFVALDMSMCIATGTPWHGHAVRMGPVVYLAAEGSRGLRNRVRAWAGARLNDPGDPLWRNFMCIAGAVQLRTDLDALLGVIARLDPQPWLIIVDTMARCIVGVEENSAKEMGEAIADCGKLQEATGATVQLVHHTGKGESSDTERGSSAIRAAADTMMLVNRDSAGRVCIEVTKQKEAEGGEKIRLNLVRVDLGVREDGSPESSCRLSLDLPETAPPSSHPELDAPGLKLCLTLRDSFAQSGATPEQLWMSAKLSRSSFYRLVKPVLSKGYIERHGTGAKTRYVLAGKFAPAGVS